MKVIFILNSIQSIVGIKRVNEFISHGYDVNVYAFSRKFDFKNQSLNFPINVIGEYGNELSYLKRVFIISRGIKSVIKKYKNIEALYYIFQLDMALIFSFFSKKALYIYEEYDLVHTGFSNKIVKYIFEYFDKKIIRGAVSAVFTSEGFRRYHFGDKKIENVFLIPNRLSSKVLELPQYAKNKCEVLRIGFVGFPRYNSVINFIKVYCENYPQYEFHIYGGPISDGFSKLKKYKNCFFHGIFSSPEELPKIYSEIDLVLSTYDVSYENVRYAEPNKLYEAIYFETPIIVSSGTFLSEKVEKLGIGYSINALDDGEVINFIKNLTEESLKEKINNESLIPRKDLIDKNDEFFDKLTNILKC